MKPLAFELPGPAVAEAADFVNRLQPQRERCWIAELLAGEDTTAKLRLPL